MDAIYTFSNFQLDGSERLLYDGGMAINLAPKVFDTLLMLVRNAGHVLSKEKMLAEIWDDSFVEENNLAQNISQLRRVLGENANIKFIETVPKFGYRFVAEVSAIEKADSTTEIFETVRARIYVEDEVRTGSIGDWVLPPVTHGGRYRSRFRLLTSVNRPKHTTSKMAM